MFLDFGSPFSVFGCKYMFYFNTNDKMVEKNFKNNILYIVLPSLYSKYVHFVIVANYL